MGSVFSFFQTAMTAVLAFGIAAIGAILVSLCSKDAETLIPKWAARVVEFAAFKIPQPFCDQLREEWLAGLDEYPEVLAKAWFAISIFVRAGPKTLKEVKRAIRQSHAMEAGHAAGSNDRQIREQIQAEIARLEFRLKQLDVWLKRANKHSLRRQAEAKSLEAEDLAKRIRYLKSLL